MNARGQLVRAFAGAALSLALFGLHSSLPLAARAAQSRRGPDYLTQVEADKIRDAQSPDDRMKKFQYELSRTVHENRHDEMLNGLLNDYVGCVDDAADQIDVAQEKQVDIRGPLKMMKDKNTEFLQILQKVKDQNPDIEAFRDNLEDAIQGTKDALESIDEATKAAASSPAPVRRKQQ
jgi:hypothetical protein